VDRAAGPRPRPPTPPRGPCRRTPARRAPVPRPATAPAGKGRTPHTPQPWTSP
jgi:hypothetical protein